MQFASFDKVATDYVSIINERSLSRSSFLQYMKITFSIKSLIEIEKEVETKWNNFSKEKQKLIEVGEGVKIIIILFILGVESETVPSRNA